MAVWDALRKAPGLDDLNNGPRLTLAAKLKPYRRAADLLAKLHLSFPPSQAPVMTPVPEALW